MASLATASPLAIRHARAGILHGRPAARRMVRAAQASSGTIRVVRNPGEDVLQKLKVSSWPTWSCGVSEFPWTYGEQETAYMLEGRVIVTPDGGEPTEIQAGDLATFPEGMSCRWDVKAPLNKHYNFG